MRYCEITEGRDAALYHGTSYHKAIRILASDKLEPNTNHISKDRPGSLIRDIESGISLTRNRRTAFDFGPVVFELDQRALSQRHRIVPVDYWGHSPETKLSGTRRKDRNAEAEEFLIGELKPVSKYLVAIHIDPHELERMRRFTPSWMTSTDGARLFQNRLLRVGDKSIEPLETLAKEPLV